MSILHLYRTPGLAAATRRALLDTARSIAPSVEGVETEYCFNVETASPLESAELAKHHHSISVPGRYTSTPSAPRPTSASDFKLMPCCCWVFGSM